MSRPTARTAESRRNSHRDRSRMNEQRYTERAAHQTLWFRKEKLNVGGIVRANITHGLPDTPDLSQRECDFDRHQHGNGLAEARAGRELPLPRRFHGFLIEPERRVERAHDFDVAHGAVGLNDALQQHGALNLRAHRLGGVLRLHFLEKLRRLDAVAGSIGASTGAAAPTFAEAGSGARADTGAGARAGAAATPAP